MADTKRDRQTVTPDGESIQALPHGVSFHETPTQVDERGTVVELYDLRWNWHPDPLVFAYTFTLRPGMIKGWGMHKRHDDRYCILFGRVLVVLYDDRPDSPTRGLVSEIVLSEYNRRLINIPAGVWHADRNIGDTEAVVINFPTTPYDHANPDKYRLPLDNDHIPYRFKGGRGW